MTEENVLQLPAGISVVVPVYNSEGSLALLVKRLEPVLQSSARQFEVILVNDGSRDRSWNIIQGLAEANGWVRGVNLMRNYGQHNALLCGIRAAKFNTIATLDDDLQNPPEELPKLLACLKEDVDVVYGKPEHERHGLFRNLASRITKLTLQHAMGAEVAGQVSAFRVFRTVLRQAFAGFSGPFVSLDALLTYGTRRFRATDVQHEARSIGQSNYTVAKLVRHALNMITSFSILPLQIASMIGFGLTLFGVAILMYVVARYLLAGGTVPGFAFLASTISIFSGAQLFGLGIIGEYLARVHLKSMGRPSFVIREHTSMTGKER